MELKKEKIFYNLEFNSSIQPYKNGFIAVERKADVINGFDSSKYLGFYFLDKNKNILNFQVLKFNIIVCDPRICIIEDDVFLTISTANGSSFFCKIKF